MESSKFEIIFCCVIKFIFVLFCVFLVCVIRFMVLLEMESIVMSSIRCKVFFMFIVVIVKGFNFLIMYVLMIVMEVCNKLVSRIGRERC